jgi:hypothetical protein
VRATLESLTKGETSMDAAAVGTALIGLEAVRGRSTPDELIRPWHRAPRRAPGRVAIASLLRALAAAIEPRSHETAAGT